MKKIENLKQLQEAADQKRAVVVPGTVWEKPKPATVLLFQPGIHLLKLFDKGMYIYEKERKHGTRKV